MNTDDIYYIEVPAEELSNALRLLDKDFFDIKKMENRGSFIAVWFK